MSSSFGKLFRVSTFGESHCPGVGVVVDGCLPGMYLTEPDIQYQLDRRRPGQSTLSTDRQESDQVTIQSGTELGLTLGTPISLFVPNKDHRPGDYKSMADIPRPSHADFTYQSKYGIRASSGGGRSSARETIGRVCAGAIAEKMLNTALGIDIVAWVSQVGQIKAPETDGLNLTRAMVDASMIRCPDADSAKAMEAVVLQAKEDKDSIGGVVSCICTNVPAGLGEPIFDKLEALLAHAMLSIPATKGFEIGSGFAGAQMRGSEHNDPFVKKDGRLGTTTNFSGGIQGGISNGEPIMFRVAFKPPATIGLAQETVDFQGRQATLAAEGRHDPCVVSRAVPIVESMAALVLADVMLQQQARLAGTALMKKQ
ncbi:chorismate synthase [Desulfobacter hydrogenophilus]|uniref:Chorismate synthase n=1 Tax=Desulfobacter hydrogenophilus TaxID=2291 RepID=A0A328FHI8_9BACT|nr:chorismate synthase [Desulfobacter hydrogenophilus]NDY71080.1 chorismate synthase [Desulfobacter hydrogenophilus]QBH11718.1 chorismate synthase [Desulfobacter hydrogenophilus]RAM02932.1 chorismate synthase [Desulfobacter hydrogenophilus]